MAAGDAVINNNPRTYSIIISLQFLPVNLFAQQTFEQIEISQKSAQEVFPESVLFRVGDP